MVLLPSPELRDKLGTIIKEKRRTLHLSQAELAKGICTQTTISTLENKICFNKWEIVPEILKRLEIDVNCLKKVSNYHYGEKYLEHAEKYLLIHKFDKALQILLKIKKENLDSKELLARYNCNLAFCQLFLDFSIDDVMQKFSRVINKHATKHNQLIVGWSNLGIALSLRRLKMQKNAMLYFDKAINNLDNSLELVKNNNDLWVTIHFALALVVFGFINAKYKKVQRKCDKLIGILHNNYSYYCLKDFYYMKYKSLVACNHSDKAEQNLTKVASFNALPTNNHAIKLLQFEK